MIGILQRVKLIASCIQKHLGHINRKTIPLVISRHLIQGFHMLCMHSLFMYAASNIFLSGLIDFFALACTGGKFLVKYIERL